MVVSAAHECSPPQIRTTRSCGRLTLQSQPQRDEHLDVVYERVCLLRRWFRAMVSRPELAVL